MEELIDKPNTDQSISTLTTEVLRTHRGVFIFKLILEAIMNKTDKKGLIKKNGILILKDQ